EFMHEAVAIGIIILLAPLLSALIYVISRYYIDIYAEEKPGRIFSPKALLLPIGGLLRQRHFLLLWALTTAVTLLLYIVFGLSIQFFAAVCVAALLIALSYIDIYTGLLPDHLTKALIITGPIQGLWEVFAPLYASVYGIL